MSSAAPAASAPANVAGHHAATPPRDATHVFRVLALAAALAASVLTPGLLAGGQRTNLVLFAVAAVLGVALLLALQGRLPLPRSLGSAFLWVSGTVLLTGGGTIAMTAGAIGALAAKVEAVATAAGLAWLGAVLLNSWEAHRAFATARRLHRLRSIAWRLSMLVLLPPCAWWTALWIEARGTPWLLNTPAESLVPGAALLGGVAVLALGSALTVQLPRALASWQLRGQVAVSAASETLWFASLATITLPVGMAFDTLGGPWWAWRPPEGTGWGDICMRTLMVVLAHGAVRLALGRAASAAPVPLLALVACEVPSPVCKRFLARLPRAWAAGPVWRVMPPLAALNESGAHLQVARLTGQPERLFAQTPEALRQTAADLPPAGLWRALPVREAYADQAVWSDLVAAALTPQTWVLLVDDDARGATDPWPPGLIAALPPDRSVRVALGLALNDQRTPAAGEAADTATVPPSPWPAAWQALPCWRDEAFSGDAEACSTWLRAQVAPDSRRLVMLLHAHADRALADALAARLNGRNDTQGRFIEAVPIGQGERVEWRMPLTGFRAVQQVLLRSIDERARRTRPTDGLFNWLLSLWLRLLTPLSAALLGVRVDAASPPFDLVLLHSAALREAAQRWPEQGTPALVREARRRIAVRLDAQAVTLCPTEGQIDAATPSAAEPDGLAEQLRTEQWVGLAAPSADGAAPGHAPPDDEAAAAGTSPPPASTVSGPRTDHRLLLVSARWPDGPGSDIGQTTALVEALTRGLGPRIAVGHRHLDEPEATGLLSRAWLDGAVLITSPGLAAEPRLAEWLTQAAHDNVPCHRIVLTRSGTLPADVVALPCANPTDADGEPIALDQSLDTPAGRWPALVEQTARRLADALGMPRQADPSAAKRSVADGASADEAASPAVAPVQADPAGPAAGDAPVRAQADAGVGPGEVSAMAASRDGQVFLGYRDGRVERLAPGRTPGGPTTPAQNDDRASPLLATGDVQHGPLTGHRNAVTALCPLVQSGWASGGADGRVMAWDGAGHPGRLLGEHAVAVRALATAGDAVMVGDGAGALRAWSLASDGLAGSRWQLDEGIAALGCDTEDIYVLGESGRLWQIQARDGATPVLLADVGTVSCLACTDDTLYLGGEDAKGRGVVRRRPLRRGGLPSSELGGLPAGPVRRLHVLHDERVVFAADNAEVFVWSPSLGANRLDALGRAPAPVRELAAAADTLFVLDAAGQLQRWPLPGLATR